MSDGVSVRLVHVHVVHIRLPVFYETAVIRRDQPVIVVRPFHRSNRCVMCLNHYKQLDILITVIIKQSPRAIIN